jgi:hypothetical protein
MPFAIQEHASEDDRQRKECPKSRHDVSLPFILTPTVTGPTVIIRWILACHINVPTQDNVTPVQPGVHMVNRGGRGACHRH